MDIWFSVNMSFSRILLITVLYYFASATAGNYEGFFVEKGSLDRSEKIDGVRESTISVPNFNRINDGLETKHQKLLQSKVTAADLSPIESFDDVIRMRQFIRKRMKPCPSRCRRTFHKLNGDPYVCRCSREVSEQDECQYTFCERYCRETNGSCYDETCVVVIPGKQSMTLVRASNSMRCQDVEGSYNFQVWQEPGHQSLRKQVCQILPCMYVTELIPYTNYDVRVVLANGTILLSKTITTLELAPGPIRDLTIESASGENVIGKWKPPLETKGCIRNYTVTIQRIKLIGCEDLKRTSPPEPKAQIILTGTMASFNGLHPYAQYNFTVIANTVEPGPPLSKVFETPQLMHPTSKISNLHIVNESILVWNRPKNCTTITGPANTTKIIVSGVSDLVKNWKAEIVTTDTHYDLKTKHVLPYTQYRIRAWIVRSDGDVSTRSDYQEKFWTTAPAAPPAVKNVFIYEADSEENTMSMRWNPPDSQSANGEIESYQVLLMIGNLVIQNKSIKVFELKNCTLTYVCVESFSLPSNISTNIDLEIFAKNLNVSADGNKTSMEFKLEDLYNKKPSQPENFIAIAQSHGIVTLNWTHPSFSPTKIVRFRIRIKFSRTDLLMNGCEGERIIDYPITRKAVAYSTDLHLLTSTDYRVHIMAVNYRNYTSAAMTKEISTPAAVSFANGHKLLITENRNVIKLKVPPLVNLTTNTTVSVNVKGLSPCEQKSSRNPSSSTNKTFHSEWLAAEYLVNNSEPVDFTFNVSQHYGVERNCFFKPQETYKFQVILKVPRSMRENQSMYKFFDSDMFTFNNEESFLKRSKIWLLSIPVLIICLLLFIISYWKYRRAGNQSSDSDGLTLVNIMNSSDDSLHTRNRTIPQLDVIEDRVSRHNNESDVELSDPHCYPVKIEELEEFVKEALASQLLETHWKMLPRGFLRKCKYGYLPKNKPKNQCNYVIPYDDNRVVLKKVFKNSRNDYINASYIQGYRKAKAYIATQGPKRDESTNTNTVIDFWKMIWQEDVRVICMLTNLNENGERKCEQYWPEVGNNMEYGDAFVLNIEHQVFTDYTIRTLQLICRDGRREIKQFHYTAWPENGVPMFTQSLAIFMKKLLAAPVGEGPMVVHGCVGVGRTGTLILCDICLRQAIEEQVINIPAVTLKIRQDRANMVGTAQQYLLAHLVIAECKILERTQISCNDELKEKIEKLRQVLPSDIQRLKEIMWQDRALHSFTMRTSILADVSSNKLWKSGQDHSCLAELSLSATLFDIRSGSFNAVKVEGVKRKNQFLATKQPSAFTLPDFGNFLADKKIELIIVLQLPNPEDTNKCDVMPNKPSSSRLSHIEFQARRKLGKKKYFTTERLELLDTSQVEAELQHVTILTCTEWACKSNKTLPPVEALVSLWMASGEVKCKDSPILVICRDGVTGCGLYLALSYVLERMSMDKECDVISAVRIIQRSSQNFVQSLDQIEYLYDAAINYNAQFATYAELS